MSQAQNIREYIKTALTNAATGVDQIYSNRDFAIPEEVKSAICIYDTDETATEPVTYLKLSQRTVSLTIEALIETESPDLDAQLDTLAEKIEQAIQMDFDTNQSKPYRSIFYRSRRKFVDSAGGIHIGVIEMKYDAAYEKSF